MEPPKVGMNEKGKQCRHTPKKPYTRKFNKRRGVNPRHFFLPYIAVFLYYIHVLFIPGLALQSLCFGSLMIDVLCSILKMMYVTLDNMYHKWIIMMA